MLSCDQLTINLNQQNIIKNLGVTLFPGSCLMISGPNGSGKSTLLKALGGLISPTHGKILINNINIQEDLALYQQNICYISHKNAIKLSLSVIDNLAFWAELKNTEILLPAALNYFGLDNHLDTICSNLSAGWLRRVALARLILSTGKIWLLDEPESNLDKQGKELLCSLINTRVSEGGIVIIASHGLDNLVKCLKFDIVDYK